jgi:hypothetical protein
MNLKNKINVKKDLKKNNVKLGELFKLVAQVMRPELPPWKKS